MKNTACEAAARETMRALLEEKRFFLSKSVRLNYAGEMVSGGERVYLYRFKQSFFGRWHFGLCKEGFGITRPTRLVPLTALSPYRKKTLRVDAAALLGAYSEQFKIPPIVEPEAARQMELKRGRGCLVSKDVLEGKLPIGAAYRTEGLSPADSGWRFVSGELYGDFSKESNMVFITFREISALGIDPDFWDNPIGTTLYRTSENAWVPGVRLKTPLFLPDSFEVHSMGPFLYRKHLEGYVLDLKRIRWVVKTRNREHDFLLFQKAGETHTMLKDFSALVKQHAAHHLLAFKNDYWLDELQSPLQIDDFISRLELVYLEISSGGLCCRLQSDLFSGKQIEVHFDSENNFLDATI